MPQLLAVLAFAAVLANMYFTNRRPVVAQERGQAVVILLLVALVILVLVAFGGSAAIGITANCSTPGQCWGR